DLPAGSRVHGDASVGAFHGAGRLGECRVKTAAGDIRLERTGPLDLNTGAGAISVDRGAGSAEGSTRAGRGRLPESARTAVSKNSNGDSWVGEVAGDLRVNSANGNISVDRADADVNASTANGDVRVGGVRRGSASLKTSLGEIEVGIQAGTAARLDVHTQ